MSVYPHKFRHTFVTRTEPVKYVTIYGEQDCGTFKRKYDELLYASGDRNMWRMSLDKFASKHTKREIVPAGCQRIQQRINYEEYY